MFATAALDPYPRERSSYSTSSDGLTLDSKVWARKVRAVLGNTPAAGFALHWLVARAHALFAVQATPNICPGANVELRAIRVAVRLRLRGLCNTDRRNADSGHQP